MGKAAPIDRFKRGETVKVLEALPGVPQGTKGRVYLVDGFAWIRYRVLFDNGVDIGSLDGSVLARPKQYEEALARRTPADEPEPAEAGGADPAAAEGASAGDAPRPASSGDGTAGGGKKIPAHLLERSKKARARSGGDASGAPSGDAPAQQASDEAAAETPASDSEGTTASGKKIPAHLLERSKQARERSGA